jgi:serine/threonine protein kinase
MHKARVVAEKQVEHIQQERKLLQRIDHPFIISLEWAFQSHESLFLVMEFCQGGDLYETMQARPVGARHFSEPESRFICAELVLALGHIHAMGTVFRDLKPENVLFDMAGHVRLTDFGLAKPMARGAPSLRETVCGTPLYMSPEGVRNHKQALLQQQRGNQQGLVLAAPREGPLSELELLPGYANDWWMLGILSFELMVGHTPFDSVGMSALHDAILSQELLFTASIGTSDTTVKATATLPRSTGPCTFLNDAEQGTRPAAAATPPISELGQSFVRGLLDKSPVSRLGAASTAEVQSHAWFAALDWVVRLINIHDVTS